MANCSFQTLLLPGVQHAGKGLAEVVRKLRNPMMNPGFVLSKTFELLRRKWSKRYLTLGLAQFVHPTLQVEMLILDYCVNLSNI